MSASPPGPAVHGVILAGGRGVRLWPLSREMRGKQFLALAGAESLIRTTAVRLLPLAGWDRLMVVLEERQVPDAARELPELKPARLVAEPRRANTAPAIALAAHLVAREDPEAVMVVSPADHVIGDEEEFRRALRAAIAAARAGALVTLGMKPTHPETGFGYIAVGPVAMESEGLRVHRALGFVEKPSLEKAKELVEGGAHLWNSGVFIWKASTILAAIEEHLPDVARAFEGVAGGDDPGGEMLARAYAAIQPVSIDYGVMERAANVMVVPASVGWNDVGSWRALDDIWPADREGNRVRGDAVLARSRNVTVFGDGSRVIAGVGLDDIIIVDTPDALLVCSKKDAQEVREIVERLEKEGRKERI